ncbi:hypothetical protein N0V93_003414 [Gnomoniopsis smithogilvyi]|uniref:Clr5 domain-containing protein n=1 Tax=Gnomoniopsis smithogilvyi TaxID=1191159 RepID=A0A9W9CZU3_9PEZI|nr:hypothetical protein N0V93_003414 [Gnomoniopsis smithogilvyi]
MVEEQPSKKGSRAAANDEAWTKHLPTIRRLYVDEAKTLKQLMDFMETEHNFKASYDDSEQIECRFRRWGFRKNIRLHEVKDEVSFHELTKARYLRNNEEVSSSSVQLASGQVVDVDRLAAHLRRKMLYKRQTQKPFGPTYVNPPEQFYVCEAVLDDTRAYLRGHYQDAFTFTEEVDGLRVTQPATLKWNRFFYRCRGALDHPSRFSQALVLMRQAPEELRQLLESEPASVLNLLFKFIIHVTRCLQNIDDPDDKRQFSVVVRALIRYAASVMAPQHGQQYPLYKLLRTLARIDDDELYPVAVKAWKLSCLMWDDIATATQSQQDPNLIGTPRPRGSAATVSDWLGFLAVAPDEVPLDVEHNINMILQALRRVFGKELARRVDEMWAVREDLAPIEAVGKDEVGSQDRRRMQAAEDQVYSLFNSVVGPGFESKIPKILFLRSLDDAKKALQSAKMAEQYWWSQGEYGRAEAAALWVGDLSGDT